MPDAGCWDILSMLQYAWRRSYVTSKQRELLRLKMTWSLKGGNARVFKQHCHKVEAWLHSKHRPRLLDIHIRQGRSWSHDVAHWRPIDVNSMIVKVGIAKQWVRGSLKVSLALHLNYTLNCLAIPVDEQHVCQQQCTIVRWVSSSNCPCLLANSIVSACTTIKTSLITAGKPARILLGALSSHAFKIRCIPLLSHQDSLIQYSSIAKTYIHMCVPRGRAAFKAFVYLSLP